MKKKKKTTVVDAALQVLRERREPMSFKELIEQAFQLMGKEIEGKLSHYHTEINMDRRFAHMGNTQWGLKEWAPVKRSTELIAGQLPEHHYQPSVDDYLWDDEEEEDPDAEEAELLVPGDDDLDYEDEEEATLDINDLDLPEEMDEDSEEDSEEEEEKEPLT